MQYICKRLENKDKQDKGNKSNLWNILSKKDNVKFFLKMYNNMTYCLISLLVYNILELDNSL